MITISNSEICVAISKSGAEIHSIKRDGREYMWSRDPAFWAQSAPIMFPICGGLKGGKYELDGKMYEMSKHGFAKLSEFEVEVKTDTSVTFILHDNEKTRAMYPFAFAFRVRYELDGASLRVTYDAENLDKKTMYCTFGAHEAYACPEGIEAYELVFPEKETLYAYGLNGDIVTDYTKLIVNNSNLMALDDKHFALDALVFRNVKSNSVTLKSKVSDRRIKVDFDGFDYLVLWHKHTSPYLCIEPWCGLPDVSGSSYSLAEKEGMHALPAGAHFARTHVITVG
ncbi:MAG: aldose 1-epimerase family protein [Ruminococcaceae bacterium]|nr:aldose 1-epimerase family protein [Oscillospiraceae bacterium]